MKYAAACLWAAGLLWSPVLWAAPPPAFDYEGGRFAVQEDARDLTRTVRADLDGNRREETITLFQARHDGDIKLPVAFVWIEWDDGKTLALPVGDYPGDLRPANVDGDDAKELVVFARSGVLYTNLLVYRFNRRSPERLFKNGSACPVEFTVSEGLPTIRIARADLSQAGWTYASGRWVWEVYEWDGKVFKFNRAKSSTDEIGELGDMRRMAERPLKGEAS